MSDEEVKKGVEETKEEVKEGIEAKEEVQERLPV